MKLKSLINIVLGMLLLLIVSCSSMNNFQSPNVTPKGEYEIGAGASFLGIPDDTPAIVNLEAFTRFGLKKSFDTGVKVFGIPGLSGGLMTDLKCQISDDPIYISTDLGASYCYTKDLNYYDIYPMLIAGSERFYGGYRGIYHSGVDDGAKIEFNSYLHSIFLGCKYGPGPYLRPEIAFYTHDLKHGFFILGLALQFK